MIPPSVEVVQVDGVERAWVEGVPVLGHRAGAPVPEGLPPIPAGVGEPAIVWDGGWRGVRVETVRAPRSPAVWRVFRGEGGQRLALDLLSRTASADVWEFNPVVSSLERVELTGLVVPDALVGQAILARSCDDAEVSSSLLQPSLCHATSSHAEPDASGDFVYPFDPEGPVDGLAEVQLYHQATTTVDWMRSALGVTLPTPIVAHANFPWANAFYGDFDGDAVADISFGQADGVDLGYDGDVVTHELGHAAVALLSPDLPFVTADGWGLEWAGGAVNEGAADVFAMLRSGDPQVGEYAGGAFGDDAVRDLSTPRRCPDHLIGEVHHDGEIFGSFAWSLIDDPAVGPDLVGELLVGAIPKWGPGASWDRVGAAVRAAADELVELGVATPDQRTRIGQALDRSGMEGCGRSIPLDDGRSVELALFNVGLEGELARLPGAVQLTLEVPTHADDVWVDVREFSGTEGLRWALYARAGEPVGHEASDLGGLGLGYAVPTTWDQQIEGGGPDRAWRLDAAPLRGQTLYLSVASVNDGSLIPLEAAFGRLEVSAFAAVVAAPEPPGGCATGGPGGRLGWLWVGVAAVVRRARRPPAR